MVYICLLCLIFNYSVVLFWYVSHIRLYWMILFSWVFLRMWLIPLAYCLPCAFLLLYIHPAWELVHLPRSMFPVRIICLCLPVLKVVVALGSWNLTCSNWPALSRVVTISVIISFNCSIVFSNHVCADVYVFSASMVWPSDVGLHLVRSVYA